MPFSSSAARALTADPFVPQHNPTLQMLEDFLNPFRAFASALNGVMRAPAQVLSYADWRAPSLADHVQRSLAHIRSGYAHLPTDLRQTFDDLAHELDCKAIAALVVVRRQQRLSQTSDLAFIEACRRVSRSLSECLQRFDEALDAVMTLAPSHAAPHHQAPTLELVTNVTLG